MNIREKILVIEDEKAIAQFITAVLDGQGYEAIQARTGAEGLSMISSHCPDVVILDLGLPDMDGLDILRQIRSWSSLPVVVVSARTHERDKVTALDQGADDYLTKPFNILELKARIKAIIRRSSTASSVDRSTVKVGDVELDYNLRRIRIGDRSMELTSKEFDLCELFVSNPGKVYSRENLLDIIWGYDYPGDVRTVDVHVRRLREKIEPDAANPTYILTKWGVGYYFKEN